MSAPFLEHVKTVLARRWFLWVSFGLFWPLEEKRCRDASVWIPRWVAHTDRQSAYISDNPLYTNARINTKNLGVIGGECPMMSCVLCLYIRTSVQYSTVQDIYIYINTDFTIEVKLVISSSFCKLNTITYNQ